MKNEEGLVAINSSFFIARPLFLFPFNNQVAIAIAFERNLSLFPSVYGAGGAILVLLEIIHVIEPPDFARSIAEALGVEAERRGGWDVEFDGAITRFDVDIQEILAYLLDDELAVVQFGGDETFLQFLEGNVAVLGIQFDMRDVACLKLPVFDIHVNPFDIFNPDVGIFSLNIERLARTYADIPAISEVKFGTGEIPHLDIAIFRPYAARASECFHIFAPSRR